MMVRIAEDRLSREEDVREFVVEKVRGSLSIVCRA
jgi:hypothetical protein